MSVVRSKEDLKGMELENGDAVIFVVNGMGIRYSVDSNHLKNAGGNDRVFKALGIDKISFASKAYGYDSGIHGWPESSYNDYAALTRLVRALYEEIEKKEGKIITNTMNLKEKFLLAMKSEPEKSFRKAGITNGDDLLTDEGTQVYLAWRLKQDAAAFKTEVVDPLLAEKSKE